MQIKWHVLCQVRTGVSSSPPRVEFKCTLNCGVNLPKENWDKLEQGQKPNVTLVLNIGHSQGIFSLCTEFFTLVFKKAAIQGISGGKISVVWSNFASFL